MFMIKNIKMYLEISLVGGNYKIIGQQKLKSLKK